MHYHSQEAVLPDQASSLRFAAAGNERPLWRHAGKRADIEEIMRFVPVAGEKDLPRDLTAHNPGMVMRHPVSVQGLTQPGSPAGIVNILAPNSSQIQDAGQELDGQVSQDAAAFQPLQGIDQPGRIGRRDVQDLNIQDLARIGLVDEGDVLIRPLEDDRIRTPLFAQMMRQLNQMSPVADIHLLRVLDDLRPGGQQLQILHFPHETLAGAADPVKGRSLPANQVPGREVDGIAPPLFVFHSHELVLFGKDHAYNVSPFCFLRWATSPPSCKISSRKSGSFEP